MKQAHKKRPPHATANSPPTLPADGQKLFYKSDKFKAQTGGTPYYARKNTAQTKI